ncbi:MBL fold metallo-hydrolase [Paenibacillus sp. sptzw28]|uniref:MBL fold metallo-hydrolase n=1 Tax=Paenibacillus sp. sptzw28 TaxID=715179 RepID=UPI001C6EE6F0|nr:MBL fold metallo-hydrolase [Paenibacillus sp. sptzw28]QYR21048.1 MBL fold metallo-hydrolase [Paenibacillus sp. sptzw28]
MAEKTRLPGNAQGDFYVNSACIDCDICRQLAPEIFTAMNGLSAVARQPETDEDRRRAFHSLLACPTGAIGSELKDGLVEAMNEFPLLLSEDVYFCGYSSAKSYGGHSYFIKRPEGNWLIDAPRFVAALVKKLDELGGISTIFLTHNDTDEKSDADRYANRFGAEVVIHADEEARRDGKECLLTGAQPVQWHPDLTLLPVPGHTKGHTVLLYKDTYLFAGDHLHWDRHMRGLSAVRDYCFYSWIEQTESMERLERHSFRWVLPRHGEWIELERTSMNQELIDLVERMRNTD